MISALYVRGDSIYKQLGVDCWDIERDALLYIVGCPKDQLPKIPIRMDAVSHYVGYPKSFKGKSRNGMKEISKREREATPTEFAKWLIQVAERCEVVKHTTRTIWENYCPTDQSEVTKDSVQNASR